MDNLFIWNPSVVKNLVPEYFKQYGIFFTYKNEWETDYENLIF